MADREYREREIIHEGGPAPGSGIGAGMVIGLLVVLAVIVVAAILIFGGDDDGDGVNVDVPSEVDVTVLRIQGGEGRGSEDLENVVASAKIPEARRRHIDVRVVESTSPVSAVVDEVRRGRYDLVVIGVAKTWGLTPAFFGVRHERLVEDTTASLLIVRKHGPAHAASGRDRNSPAAGAAVG